MTGPAAALFVLFILALGLIVVFAVVQLGRDEDPSAAERPAGRPPPKPYLKLAYPPSRIELLPCEEIPWTDSAEANARAQRLLALGFQDAGRYQNSEYPNLYGWAFVHPNAGVTMILMTAAGNADYFEMATHYADGSSYCLANGPLGRGPAAQPPHYRVQHVDEADPASVYERMLRERPYKPLDPDHLDNFAARYEHRWARRIDWLNARGGYTEDEIRAACASQGLDATDEMITDCRERIRSSALRGIEEAVLEQFLAREQLNAAEAEALWSWTVLIHDGLEFDMIVPMFERRWKSVFHEDLPDPCPLAEEVRELGKRPREAFALLNERLPGPRFSLVAQFTTPIESDLYMVEADKLPPGMRPRETGTA
jgi:hypothetical protein